MGIVESHTKRTGHESFGFDLSKCGNCREKMHPERKWYFYHDKVYCSHYCRNTSMRTTHKAT